MVELKYLIFIAFVPLTRCFYNYKIKDGDVGRACSTHGREEACIEIFGRKT
jgi:hypothetical protein